MPMVVFEEFKNFPQNFVIQALIVYNVLSCRLHLQSSYIRPLIYEYSIPFLTESYKLFIQHPLNNPNKSL